VLRYLGDELLMRGDPTGSVLFSSHFERLAALVGVNPRNPSALMYLFEGLVEFGFVAYDGSFPIPKSATLTFNGWRRFDELKHQEVEGRIAFMAMPFRDQQLDRVFAEYKSAVSDTGFDLRRIDENPQAGLIDNHMRVEIRKSRFMVC